MKKWLEKEFSEVLQINHGNADTQCMVRIAKRLMERGDQVSAWWIVHAYILGWKAGNSNRSNQNNGQESYMSFCDLERSLYPHTQEDEAVLRPEE